jgi:soluble lytic murein transglycosylase-like protein
LDYRQAAIDAANQYGLDPTLYVRQIQQESGFQPNIVSKAGAMGLAQLMPGTAAQLGVDPHIPEQNLQGGAHYMRQMLDRYGGDYNLALAAYNAGPGRVDAYLAGKGQLPAETQAYVPAIMGARQAPAAPPSGAARIVGGGPPAAAPAASAAAPTEPDLLSGDIGTLAKIYALTQPQPAGLSLGSALARALATQ